MAERWQQWYPHDIDAWQGSADVQALSDLAYRAVHNLMQDMWKQEDCALPDSDRELAKRSRVAARWPECRDEVLEYFRDRTPEGKITHRVQRRKWLEARDVYEKRQRAAQRTNASRSGHGDRNGDRNAPPTQEHEQVQEQEQMKRGGDAALPPSPQPPHISLPLTQGRAHIVTAAEVDAWSQAYPAVDVPSELRRLLVWLDANPEKISATVRGSKKRVVRWLAAEQDKGGRSRAGPQAARPGASVGMHSAPGVDQTASRLRREEEEKRAIVEYWRPIRAAGTPVYERECPRWVKAALDAEAAKGEAA